MRIISGRLKGLKLQAFRGRTVRPTPDRVREAMFSILFAKTGQADVLDLFAGTGALGMEAISRGARSAVFVDHDQNSLKTIRKNIHKGRASEDTQVISWDIARNLDCLRAMPRPFSLVFMDPPYARNLVSPTLKHLLQANCMARGATIVVEHEPELALKAVGPGLRHVDHRRYGQTALTFLTYSPGLVPDENGDGSHRAQV